MSHVPPSLRYTRDHEWILLEDNIATVGITDHAQHQLGDITYVEPPEEDAAVSAGDEAATVESVKASSPVFAPVSGKICEINAELEDMPQNLNHDPYGAGWIFRIEMSDEDEAKKLLTAEQYEEHLESEEE